MAEARPRFPVMANGISSSDQDSGSIINPKSRDNQQAASPRPRSARRRNPHSPVGPGLRGSGTRCRWPGKLRIRRIFLDALYTNFNVVHAWTRTRATGRAAGRSLSGPYQVSANRPCQGSPGIQGPKARPTDTDHARSKRSRFMTLFHAATKSHTNACCESSQA